MFSVQSLPSKIINILRSPFEIQKAYGAKKMASLYSVFLKRQ